MILASCAPLSRNQPEKNQPAMTRFSEETPASEAAKRELEGILRLRREMVLKSLTATPVDTEMLKAALRDIGHVGLGYRGGLFREGVSKTGRLKLYPDGYEYEGIYVSLNRDTCDAPPDDWLTQLIAPLTKGFTPVDLLMLLVFSTPPEMRPERDRLVAEADAKIRAGLLDLSSKHHQMRETTDGPIENNLARPSLAGAITIWVAQYHGSRGETARAVSSTEQYYVNIVLYQVGNPRHAMAVRFSDGYPCIGLEGKVEVSAGDPELDAALKKLVRDALAPLSELDARTWQEIRKRNSPADAGGGGLATQDRE